MIAACACMGSNYGEQHCYCEMKRRGLPLNEPAREADRKQLTEAMSKYFGWEVANHPASTDQSIEGAGK